MRRVRRSVSWHALLLVALLCSATARASCPLPSGIRPSPPRIPPLAFLDGGATFVLSNTTQPSDVAWRSVGTGCVNLEPPTLATFTVGELTSPPTGAPFTRRIDVGCVGGLLLAINNQLVHDRQLPGLVPNITGAPSTALRQAVLWSDLSSPYFLWDVDLLGATTSSLVSTVSCYDPSVGLPPASASCGSSLPAADPLGSNQYTAIYNRTTGGVVALEMQRVCGNNSVELPGMSTWWCQLSPYYNASGMALDQWTPVSSANVATMAPSSCVLVTQFAASSTGVSTAASMVPSTDLSSTSSSANDIMTACSAAASTTGSASSPSSAFSPLTSPSAAAMSSSTPAAVDDSTAAISSSFVTSLASLSTADSTAASSSAVSSTGPTPTSSGAASSMPSTTSTATAASTAAASSLSAPSSFSTADSSTALSLPSTVAATSSDPASSVSSSPVPPPIVCRTGPEARVSDSIGHVAVLPLNSSDDNPVLTVFAARNPASALSPYYLYVDVVNSATGGEADEFYFDAIATTQLVAQYYSAEFVRDDGVSGDYVGTADSPTNSSGTYTFVFNLPLGGQLDVQLAFFQVATTACSGPPVSLYIDIQIANQAVVLFTDLSSGWSLNLLQHSTTQTDGTSYPTGGEAVSFQFAVQWGVTNGPAYGYYVVVPTGALLTAESNELACVPSAESSYVAFSSLSLTVCYYSIAVPPATAVAGNLSVLLAGSDLQLLGIGVSVVLAGSNPSILLSDSSVGLVSTPTPVPIRLLPRVARSLYGGVLLVGGWSNSSQQSVDVWSSDSTLSVWTDGSSALQLPASLHYFGTAAGSQCAVVAGGQLSSGASSSGVYTACLDSSGGSTWQSNTSSGSSAFSSRLAPMLAFYNSSLLMFGGYATLTAALNDVWSSTDLGSSWVRLTVAAAFQPRGGAAVTTVSQYTGGDAIVMAGGSSAPVWTDPSIGLGNDVWLSVVAGSFTLMSASAPFSPRSDASMSASAGLDPSYGQLLLLSGGVGSGGVQLGDCWVSADGGYTWYSVPLSTSVAGGSVLWLSDTSLAFFGSVNETDILQPLRSVPASFELEREVVGALIQHVQHYVYTDVPLVQIILPIDYWPASLLNESPASCSAGLLCPSVTANAYSFSSPLTWSISCPYTASGCLCGLSSPEAYFVLTSTGYGSASLTCTQDPNLAADRYVFDSTVFAPLTLSSCVNNVFVDAPPSTWCTADYFSDPGSLRHITYTLDGATQSWDSLAGCSPLLPPPVNNGTLFVSQSRHAEVGQTAGLIELSCPSGALVGPSTSTCREDGQWSPLGTCVEFPGHMCRLVDVPNSNVAQCAANEIVIGGGGQCADGSYMYESRPDDSMQAWRMSCSIDAVTYLMPTEVSTQAVCCLADETTFLEVPPAYTAQLSSASPVTFSSFPSSSLQLCERYTMAAYPFGESPHCPSDKQLIASGPLCTAIGWIISSAPGEYACTTPDSGDVITPSHVTMVCCEPFTAPVCTSHYTTDGSPPACPTGQSVVAAGFYRPPTVQDSGSCYTQGDSCGVTDITVGLSSMLYTADVTYVSINFTTDELTGQVNSPPYGVQWSMGWDCCPFDAASNAITVSSVTCPPYTPPSGGVGTISSSNVAFPNSVGATYTLSCPEQYSYLNGTYVITCQSSGQWLPKQLGVCEVINDDQVGDALTSIAHSPHSASHTHCSRRLTSVVVLFLCCCRPHGLDCSVRVGDRIHGGHSQLLHLVPDGRYGDDQRGGRLQLRPARWRVRLLDDCGAAVRVGLECAVQ